MKTQRMAYIHYLIVMLSVICYNSVFTKVIINQKFSAKFANEYGSDVLQIYRIITHLKNNISALEEMEESLQSKIDSLEAKEKGMQNESDALEVKETAMQGLIDSMQVKEKGMQGLIDALEIKQEGMQGIIDAMIIKEEGMQNLMIALKLKEEEMQRQVNHALETNVLLLKTKDEVMDLRQQNENLVEQNTNITIFAEQHQTEIDDCKGNICLFTLYY